MIDWYDTQIRQKIPLTTLIRRWTEWQPWGTLVALYPSFWSHSPVESENLSQHKAWRFQHRSYSTISYLKERGYSSLRPMLYWPWANLVQLSDFHTRPEELSAAGKHEVTNDVSRPSWILRFYTNISKEFLSDSCIASLSHIASPVLKLNLTSDEQLR